jgi:SEC-C motif-containing protein
MTTSPQSPDTSPSALILARIEAFRHGDFGRVYDTYHPASNFRRQFPDRAEYIRHGWANLGKEFRIRSCTIIREECAATSARVIFWLEFDLHGASHGYAELAWLERDAEGWRYRCGQKLTADELPVPAARLDFSHFDRLADKVIY